MIFCDIARGPISLTGRNIEQCNGTGPFAYEPLLIIMGDTEANSFRSGMRAALSGSAVSASMPPPH
jgi:hypothetical protein